jgi:hypothetical protein
MAEAIEIPVDLTHFELPEAFITASLTVASEAAG